MTAVCGSYVEGNFWLIQIHGELPLQCPRTRQLDWIEGLASTVISHYRCRVEEKDKSDSQYHH